MSDFLTLSLNVLSFILLALTAYIAHKSNTLTTSINKQETIREKNNALISLYDHISNIPKIDIDYPVWDDAVVAMNKLELIAVAYATKLTHQKYLYLLLSKLFIEVYEQVYNAKDANDKKPYGQLIIAECPYATQLYKKWLAERKKQRKSYQQIVEQIDPVTINEESLQHEDDQKAENGSSSQATYRGTQ